MRSEAQISSSLLLNPKLVVRTFEIEGRVVNLQVAAPKVGRPLRLTSINKKNHQSSFDQVVRIILGRDKVENVSIDSETKEWLIESQILIESQEESELPSLELVIRSQPELRCRRLEYLKTSLKCSSKWVLSENIVNSRSQSTPIHFGQRMYKKHLREFLGKAPVTWIRDWLTGVWWPYFLDDDLSEKLNLVQQGSLAIEDLEMPDKNVFQEIGILIPHNSVDLRAEYVSRLKSEYRERGSLFIPSVINEYQRVSIRQYFLLCETQGYLRLGDSQSYQRYWTHNDVVSRFLQSELSPLISEAVSEDYLPCFTYSVAYLPDSSLTKHVDREQASISVSILFDYETPEGVSEDQWPIYVERSPGSDEYYEYLIGYGNAALFFGEKFVHFRKKIPDGHSSRNLLMHFRKSQFTGKIL